MTKHWRLIAIFAVLALVSLPAYAALTRAKDYVGASFKVASYLEDSMLAAGIPDQCRVEAHMIMSQYLAYGRDDDPAHRPRLTILCAFERTGESKAKGVLGNTIGQVGRVGGVRYIHFRSDRKTLKRYVLPQTKTSPGQQASFFSRFLHHVSSPGATTPMPACTSTRCGSAGLFSTPLAPGYRESSGFGWRIHPIHGTRRMHNGDDFAAACGTTITAAGAGVVETVGFQSSGAGHYVTIRHPNGVLTKYFHMQSATPLTRGAVVQAGQPIGRVGNTGGSTGCHLHFETWVGGRAVDPSTVTGIMTAGELTPEQIAALQNTVPSADEAAGLLEGGLAGDVSEEGMRPTSGASVYPTLGTAGAGEEAAHDDHDGHDH